MPFPTYPTRAPRSADAIPLIALEALLRLGEVNPTPNWHFSEIHNQAVTSQRRWSDNDTRAYPRPMLLNRAHLNV